MGLGTVAPHKLLKFRVSFQILGIWLKRFWCILIFNLPERKSSVNQATVGWRDAYYGNEGNWGSIVETPITVTNGPADTDVYRIPQNMAYI